MLRAGGATLDSLAKKFKIDRTALHRHWHDHVTPEAKAGYLAGVDNLAALRDKAADEADSVLDYLNIVRTALLASLMTMQEAGDGRGVASVATALIGCLERIGKITGQISAITSQTNINVAIVNSPQWLELSADILRALVPHPAARAAVARVIHARAAGTDPAALPPPAVPPVPVPPIIEATAVRVE
jgi:hypothetical protein